MAWGVGTSSESKWCHSIVLILIRYQHIMVCFQATPSPCLYVTPLINPGKDYVNTYDDFSDALRMYIYWNAQHNQYDM